MSKKRRGRGLGGLAALGGAALLAMKLAKGDRKDAAPVEDAMKRDSKSSLTDDMRKRGEADTDVSGIEKYARETGIGTMRQPARDVPTRSAARPAARPAAQAPASSPAARPPVQLRVPPSAAPTDVSSMMSNIGTRPSFGITPGREVDPRVLNAMQRAGGMKKGGAVKKKSGGMVSKASKRADGIAKRGKTHCKIC
jgi:hypothetical protein